MTQKDTIIKALTCLGGKARMSEICKLAKEIGNFSGSQDPDATIRNCIYTHPREFCKSPEEGFWELLSYQEELAQRDKRICELEQEVEKLRTIRTEDDFVKRLVGAAKRLFRQEKEKAVGVSQVLFQMGREDAHKELEAWMDERQQSTQFHVAGDYNDIHDNNTVNRV